MREFQRSEYDLHIWLHDALLLEALDMTVNIKGIG